MVYLSPGLFVSRLYGEERARYAGSGDRQIRSRAIKVYRSCAARKATSASRATCSRSNTASGKSISPLLQRKRFASSQQVSLREWNAPQPRAFRSIRAVFGSRSPTTRCTSMFVQAALFSFTFLRALEQPYAGTLYRAVTNVRWNPPRIPNRRATSLFRHRE